MTIKVGTAPLIRAKVNYGQEIGSERFDYFEWSSFLNRGYAVKVVINDFLYNYLNLISNSYLKTARITPTPLSFALEWGNAATETLITPECLAYITEISAKGKPNSGKIQFSAIDPPSYALNHGSSDGGVFTGNISTVIKNVANKAFEETLKFAPIDPTTNKKPFIKLDVTDTVDNKNGLWYPMRMDPMTFILSLLEWSTSLTKLNTQWVVASGIEYNKSNAGTIAIPVLYIKQLPELISKLNGITDIGIIDVNAVNSDIIDLHFSGNNFLSVIEENLVTQGISSTAGTYLDKSNKKLVTNDKSTGLKFNAKDLSEFNSYTLPQIGLNKSTSIIAVPELNGGEVGLNYSDYISGRPKQKFVDLNNSLMRLMIRVPGWTAVGDSTLLGVSTVVLTWINADGEPYFLGGRWILYGFKHIVSRRGWFTDLYLYRIDHNAEAVEIPTK